MGDRALVQFRGSGGRGLDPVLSPCCYLHWAGSSVGSLLDETAERMAERGPDVAYCFARFVGIAHESLGGALSLGVWNQTEELTADDSHGDAGCFVVTVDDAGMRIRCAGGYGFGNASASAGILYLPDGWTVDEGRFRVPWGGGSDARG